MGKALFAVDLGTTTIESRLVEAIKPFRELHRINIKNPQSLYGRDVINRILTATNKPVLKAKMKAMVISSIAEMLEGSLNFANMSVNDLKGVCISGNTTMISILLDKDVSRLGEYPFSPDIGNTIYTDLSEVFTGIFDEKIPLIITGCISAFVGGDIISGIVYVNSITDNIFYSTDEAAMLVDLGTNGEMVISHDGSLYVTSAACGPAFEGCLRKQGIYGANVIDTLAILFRAGKISKEGVLCEEYLKKGIDLNGIHIDMDIIRDILMAKASIYSAICTLINDAGVSYKDIKTIYLAGGFTKNLQMDNAAFIGLWPKELEAKICPIGNASLLGASYILTNDTQNLFDEVKNREIRNISLADNDYYKDMLINNMIFGEYK